MKVLLLSIATFIGQQFYAQDLVSINVGLTLPEYTYNASTHELTVQMTIRNTGFFNASAFQVALVAKTVGSSTEYELDRVDYSGLPYPNGNTLEITGWVVDVSSIAAVPSGTYRLEARINDNQNATESNYNNNTETFGQESFQYVKPSSASLIGESLSTITTFPNPAQDFIQVSSDQLSAGESFVVSIYGTDGQLVTQTSNATQVDVSQLNKGLYFLSLETANHTYTTKFIKQ